MIDPEKLSEIGLRHAREHLEKQSYELGQQPENVAPGVYLIAASKLNKKYLFLIKTVVVNESNKPVIGTHDVVYEEKRELMSHTVKLSAIAMIANVKISIDPHQPDHLAVNIGFKML